MFVVSFVLWNDENWTKSKYILQTVLWFHLFETKLKQNRLLLITFTITQSKGFKIIDKVKSYSNIYHLWKKAAVTFLSLSFL